MGTIIKEYEYLLEYFKLLTDDEISLIKNEIKYNNTYDENISLDTACNSAINFALGKKYNMKSLGNFYHYVGDYFVIQFYIYLFNYNSSIVSIINKDDESESFINLKNNISEILIGIDLDEFNNIIDIPQQKTYIINYIQNLPITPYLLKYIDLLKSSLLYLATFIKKTINLEIHNKEDSYPININLLFNINFKTYVKYLGISSLNSVQQYDYEPKIYDTNKGNTLNLYTPFNEFIVNAQINNIIDGILNNNKELITEGENSTYVSNIKKITFIPVLFNIPLLNNNGTFSYFFNFYALNLENIFEKIQK